MMLSTRLPDAGATLRLLAVAGVAAVAVLACPGAAAHAQQVADSSFVPRVGPPLYAEGRGPRVVLDEGHANFHTLDGRYRTFGQLLADDGFDVAPLRGRFTREALGDLDVLVIANALHPTNQDVGAWIVPNPSAFTLDEIGAVRDWVAGGGGLFLIADHMPFPGAAHALAGAFGFHLLNGFAFAGSGDAMRAPLVFRRSDGTLADHPVTRGGAAEMWIDSVATFTGEAFQVPVDAVSLLTFPEGAVSLNPDTAWVFHEATPHTDVSGWSQGAVMEVGRGRIAVFGEAAMFSAQLQTQETGPVPMGMNAPVAGQNPPFLLNLVRWLAGAGAGS